MTRRAKLATIGILLASGIGIAVAQVPTLFLPSPTGQETLDVTLGGAGPQITSVYLSQVRDAAGYRAITQAATQTLTVPAGVSVLAFHGATAGTATITMPAAPVDGQKLWIYSTAGITTLTLTANTGQTIDSSLTVLAATSATAMIYQASSKTWFRIL